MLIGILTFHAQLNYGGVLQCWALWQALARLAGADGEVVVVDRWFDPRNEGLLGPYGHYGLRSWLTFFRQGLAGGGQFARWLRHRRTARFVRSLPLTPYHFCHWQEAPADLGLDRLVVGSDQVWHGGDWGEPEVYLLEGAPSVKAIAYAASFGMKTLPPGIDYAAGFRRFSAISVREAEGVKLVADAGGRAAHVVDPTLLLPCEGWYALAKPARRPRHLVCYFLAEEVRRALPVLERWAASAGWEVDLICKEPMRSDRVHVHADFGPLEFLRAFARAEACITDSFHAVMFSSVYALDTRVIRPQAAERRDMFARIEEFAATSVEGPFVTEALEDALASIAAAHMRFRRDVIEARRRESLDWLKEALA